MTSDGNGIIRMTGRGGGSLQENRIKMRAMVISNRRKFIDWLIYVFLMTKIQKSYLDVGLIFFGPVGRLERAAEKRISAFNANPVIISILPIMLFPLRAIIFPVSAIAPPVIMAVLLLILLALKPRSPAAVGTINAPEKIVSAIRSDWIMD
jgi:hypothetical protein